MYRRPNTAGSENEQTKSKEGAKTKKKFERIRINLTPDSSELPESKRVYSFGMGSDQYGVEVDYFDGVSKKSLVQVLATIWQGTDKLRGPWIIPGAMHAWSNQEVDEWNKNNPGKRVREEGKYYRKDDWIDSIQLAFVDIDNFKYKITREELVSRLKNSGYEFLIYTTHSHQAPGKTDRFRVVVFLKTPWFASMGKPILLSMLQACWRMLERSLNLEEGALTAIDETCKNPSRIYYLHAAPEDRLENGWATYIAGKEYEWAEGVELPGKYDYWNLIHNELPELISKKTNNLKVELHCPNSGTHTDGRTEGAYLSVEVHEEGLIGCMHSHCGHLMSADFIKLLIVQGRLSYDQVQKYDISKLHLNVGPVNEHAVCDDLANKLVNNIGGFYSHMDTIVMIRKKPNEFDGKVEFLEEPQFTDELHGRFEIGKNVNDNGLSIWTNIRIPGRLRSVLFNGAVRRLPKVEVIRDAFSPGYEKANYYADNRVLQTLEYENRYQFTPETAIEYLQNEILHDFPFHSKTDLSAAIGLFLSAVMTSQLSLCPGFMTTGIATQSGKSLLGEIAEVIATGQFNGPSSWKNEEDLTALLFSTAKSGNAVFNLDNLPTGKMFHSNAISQVLTASRLSGRLFHTQTTASFPTKFLIYISGNRITLDEDLTTRFMTIRFTQTTENMADRNFKYVEFKNYVLENRVKVLEALYCIASVDTSNVKDSGTRYKEWNKKVLAPIVACGLPDFAKATIVEAEEKDSRVISARLLELIEELVANAKKPRQRENGLPAGEILKSLEEYKDPFFGWPEDKDDEPLEGVDFKAADAIDRLIVENDLAPKGEFKRTNVLMGKLLSFMNLSIFNGRQLVRTGDLKKAARYKIVRK